ncbi:MAG TPA: transglycosylase SLT domain-containing protein [Rhodanobacteraceae bacterium]
MNRRCLGLVGILAAIMLAGCSTPATRPDIPPPAPVGTPSPATPASIATPPAPVQPAPQPAPDSWDKLRASFAMDDCGAPAAVAWAERETRHTQGFEAHLKASLPVLDYIQGVAAKNHVPGEFVLLPWIESHFRNVPPRRHRAAGMWQIMPATARSSGLSMNRAYDARLDNIAATEMVMRMLNGYYQRWHDWRLVDMAYNAGPYAVQKAVARKGPPAARPVIPKLPLGNTTRHHLTKLMAIACVIRQPERFHVTLPKLDPAQRLQVVKLPVPTRLHQVARLAGLPTRTVRHLNAGYRLASVSANTPMQVLLPVDSAQSLREAIAAGQMHANDKPGIYIVNRGDSLWSIAERFNVKIDELQRWNDLDGSTVHPGQELSLTPPTS